MNVPDPIAEEISEEFSELQRQEINISDNVSYRISDGPVIDKHIGLANEQFRRIEVSRETETLKPIRQRGIVDFVKTFTEDHCTEYLKAMRYEYGVYCPYCGFSEKIYNIENGKRFKCGSKECHKKFSVYINTIFQDKNCSLSDWFLLIYLNSINRKSTSSIQFGKNLNVHQKTAYWMQSKLRSTFLQDNIKLQGVVEIDEVWITRQWKGIGRIPHRKSPIIGMIERGGRIVVLQIPNRKSETILPIIERHIVPGSTIYTDGFRNYRRLTEMGYNHDNVVHSDKEFVRGNIHSNSIEGFWSHMKRSIRNAHGSISQEHAQSYLNEAVFKYNNRHLDQMERFNLMLRGCIYG